MNDFADLTDAMSDLIEEHTSDYGALIDLDAWDTDDLHRIIDIVEQVLVLRCDKEMDNALFEDAS